ncbi:putative FAE1/Type III polyketide synthase-like protein [Helianthus anomalus]
MLCLWVIPRTLDWLVCFVLRMEPAEYCGFPVVCWVIFVFIPFCVHVTCAQTGLDWFSVQSGVLHEITFCFSISVARILYTGSSYILHWSSFWTQVPCVGLLSRVCAQRPLLRSCKCCLVGLCLEQSLLRAKFQCASVLWIKICVLNWSMCKYCVDKDLCAQLGILPTNSIPSIVVNRYKLRDNIITYNLAGMGCSAGLLAIGLAKKLLHIHHNTCALIVSTESITENVYLGKDHSKFLINCLFRVGGAAILLSNCPSHAEKSKYQLLHAVHTNTSASDSSYNSIFREEDSSGIVGITINKDLLNAAIATIRPNLTSLGHLILPTKEKLMYIIHYIVKKSYIPNYNNAVEHFIPHVGGRPVLDQLQKTLGFSEDDVEASRMTLYRYGNTSSSSIWYALAYVEAKGRVKKGDRVWQIAFGSGFKCNSVIWCAMKSVDYKDGTNPWIDEIGGFPVNLGDCEPLPIYFEPSN